VIESKNVASAAVELNVMGFFNNPINLSSRVENFGLIKGAAVAVLGAAGQETVINHGRIEGNVVLGDGADEVVFGQGGTLVGDLLLGGGDDLVVVENGCGTARIADFVAGAGSDDVVDVSAFFSSLASLVANSNDTSEGLAISLDSDDALVLVGVSKSDLSTDDFSFA